MKKTVGILLSLTATIYTIWYMHYGTPYKNSGALSKIGLEHHALFVIWGVLTMAALSYNIMVAYSRYTRTRLYIIPIITAGIGMAMTLGFDFDYDIKPDYYLHCAGSLIFSVTMGVTIFALFVTGYKRDAVFRTFTYISGGVLMVDLVLLLIYKETGLIEAVPIITGYILLGIVNSRRERQYEPAGQAE